MELACLLLAALAEALPETLKDLRGLADTAGEAELEAEAVPRAPLPLPLLLACLLKLLLALWVPLTL